MALILSPPPNDVDVQGVAWKQWFFKIRNQLLVALDLTNVTGVLAPSNGGTGSSTIPTDGQVPIGNGTAYVPNTLTAGSNITITNGAGTIMIAASGGGGGASPFNVLQEDTEIPTDTSYVLAGDLDLNGFDLTVNGNLGFV